MVAEWDIVFSFQFSLLHLVIGLLDGIPTVLYAKLLHCVTGKLLDVEAVYDAVGFGECRTNNFPHGIGQIKGDFFDEAPVKGFLCGEPAADFHQGEQIFGLALASGGIEPCAVKVELVEVGLNRLKQNFRCMDFSKSVKFAA